MTPCKISSIQIVLSSGIMAVPSIMNITITVRVIVLPVVSIKIFIGTFLMAMFLQVQY